MEFDFLDTDALTELTSMLDNVNVSRENGSTSSSSTNSSTTAGDFSSLEVLENSNIWSPSAHNSSGSGSFGSSPPDRSFERPSLWSPTYRNHHHLDHNSSGNSPYICSTPTEQPIDTTSSSTSSSNSWSPNSPLNTSNSSSAYSFPPSSPPGLGLLSSIANNTSALSTKQTLHCLSLIQEIQETTQGGQWDNGRVPGTSALTAALQQHLIAHLLKQQQSPPAGPTPVSPTNSMPPSYQPMNNNNLNNNNHNNGNHHHHHHHHEHASRPMRLYRDHHGLNETKCTWSGQLPARNHSKSTIYSCKVFLGGVPFEVSLSTLYRIFRQYGNVKIEWPGKEDNPPDPKGYAYLIYENERQVKALLQNCVYQQGKESNWYYKISSSKMRFNCKDVQVIPWALNDSNFVRGPTQKLDPQKTIFVGALHGMINAEGLALIMQELFGGVIYAGIDTDRHKYPIGSARVTFNNHKSFMKAVSAAFVEIRTSKFTKKVQVDPYLEDATCSVCGLQQGPYFCRDLSCFRYFCRTCFDVHHAGEGYKTHRPLMRNANRQQQQSSRLSAMCTGPPNTAPGCC